MNNGYGADHGTKSDSKNRLLALLIALAAVLICIGLASSAMPTVDAIDSTVDATESTPAEQPDIITIKGNSSSGVAEANYKTLDDALANLPKITAGTYTFTIAGNLTIDQDIDLTDRGRIVINRGVTVTVGEVTITGKPLSADGLINSRGTLVLNGTDITTKSNHAIRINGGVLTVNGGSITSIGGIDGTTSGSAVYIGGGTVTINGGTFNSARSHTIYANSSSSTLTIKDGTFLNGTSASHVIYGYYGNITIEKGTFSTSSSGADVYVNSNSSGTSLANVTIGTVESNVVLNSIRGNGGHLTLVNATVTDVLGHFKTDSNFSGGKFLSDVSDVLPVGKVCVEEDGVWTVKDIEDGDAVVSLTRGETTYYYASLASAARDFTAGDTLTLLKDCTSDTYVNINGGWTGTLDLNGHTYRYTGNSSYAIRIGSPNNNTGYDGAGFSIVGPGSILVDSADTVALYLLPNTSNRNYPLNISIDSDVTLSNLRLSGTANVAFTEYLAEKVVQGGFVVPTADGGHRIYGDPAVALVESADGSAYLLSDYSGALTLSTAGTYSLDLRGNTLKYSTTTITVSGDGVSFTVSNGSIASTSTTVTTPVAFINNNNATLTFNDINLSAAGYWGINVNGSHTNIDLTINGGSLTSEGLAIYYPVTGTLTLRDTYITAPSGVQFCGAGSLIIDGSTITATAEALNGPTKDPSDSDGSFDDGAAVSIITRGGGYQQSGETISVSITDSKLISLNNVAYQDYRAQRTTVDEKTSWVTGSSTSLTSAVDSVEIGEGTEITGASDKSALTTDTDYSSGTYAISDVVLSSAVSDNLMADGYTSQVINGEVVISNATAVDSNFSVVVNGTTVYVNDLKQAYALVGDNGTITVLRNASISGIVFDEEKNITLNLGQYTLTVSDDSTGLTIKAGNVTITATAGGMTTSTAYALIVNEAELTIDGGTYVASNDRYARVLYTEIDSSTVIKNGTFQSTWAVVFNNAKMTINGGTFKGTSCNGCTTDHYAYTIINTSHGDLVINGKDASGATTVYVYGHHGALSSSYGTLEVNGGHFETTLCDSNHTGAAFYALYVAGEDGEVYAVINDGDFVAYNKSAAYIGNSYDGGIEAKATAIINGGSFSITDKSSAASIITVDAKTENTPTAEVYGGSFSKELDQSYLAPGVRLYESDTGDFVTAPLFTDGTGTEYDPFIISSVEQLKNFRDRVNGGNSYLGLYIEVAEGVTVLDISGEGWEPIGNGARTSTVTDDTITFAGYFNGNGVTIKGLTSSGYVPGEGSLDGNEFLYGFFGFLSGDASVANITIEGAKIDVKQVIVGEDTYIGDSVGILAGYAYGKVSISNVTVSGSVEGNDSVAGIVGRSYGPSISIDYCKSSATVDANLKSGGIIGIASSAATKVSILGCTNSGEVTGTIAAGIVGYIGGSDSTVCTIDGCTNTGAIVSRAHASNPLYAGGISAYVSVADKVTFKGCINTGNVTSAGTAGGIFAINTSISEMFVTGCSVSDCIITGSTTAGGIGGSAYGDAMDIDGATVSGVTIITTDGEAEANYAGGIMAVSGSDIIIAKSSVSDITMTVANEHSTQNSESGYAGKVTGAAVGLLSQCQAVIIGFTSDCGYELVANIYDNGGGEYTFVDCVTQTVMDWMPNSQSIHLTLRNSQLAGITLNAVGLTISVEDDADSDPSSIGDLTSGPNEDVLEAIDTYTNWTGTVNATITIAANTVLTVGNWEEYSYTSTDGKLSANGTIVGTDGSSVVSVIGGDTYSWENGAWTTAVAIAGGVGYSSLQKAIDECPVDGTVVIVQDIKLSDGITVPDEAVLTLDLNGYELTNVSGHTIVVSEGAVLTIRDSSADKTGVVDNVTPGKAAVYNYGAVTIENGTFNRSAEEVVSTGSPGNSWYLIVNSGTMTIKDGVFYTASGENGNYGNFSSLIKNGNNDVTPVECGTLTINGGTFTNAANVVKNEIGSTLSITGGEFTIDNTVNRWLGGNNLIQNYGTASITGGDYYALGSGLSADAEKYTANYRYGIVNNGTIGEISGITVTMDGPHSILYLSNTASETVTNISDVTFDIGAWSDETSGKSSKVISMTEGSIVITGGSYTGDVVVSADASLSITGGTYTVDVNNYCVEGFIIVQLPDGTYGTVEGYDVNFVVNGVVEKTVRVLKGESVDVSMAPRITDIGNGYTVLWMIGNAMFSDITPDANVNVVATWYQAATGRIEIVSGEAVVGDQITLALREGAMGDASTALWFVTNYPYLDLYDISSYTKIDDITEPIPCNEQTKNYYWAMTRDASTGQVYVAVLMVEVASGYTVNLVVGEMTGTVTVARGETVDPEDIELMLDDGYEITGYVFNGTPSATNPPIYESGTLVVNTALETFKVTVVVEGTGGGTVTPMGTTTVDYGDDLTIEVSLNAGYTVTVRVDGQVVELTDWEYTLKNITADHRIVVEFAIMVYDVSIVVEGTGGTVTPNEDQRVEYGQSVTVIVTPNDGYVATVTLDGQPVQLTDWEYTLSNVTADHTIAVTFTEWGFVDDRIEIYGGAWTIAPDFIVYDGIVSAYTVNPAGIVTVNGSNGLPVITSAAAVSADTTVTVTATVTVCGQTYTDTYVLSILHTNATITSDDGGAVVAVADTDTVWSQISELAQQTVPGSTENDWNILDVVVNDAGGQTVVGGSFTVPFSYFGVTSAEGYTFYVIHLTSTGAELAQTQVTEDGVLVTVGSFSPFAFEAVADGPTPGPSPGPEPEPGHSSDMTLYVAIAAIAVLVECLLVLYLVRRN